jgi:ankyrin repeat protein
MFPEPKSLENYIDDNKPLDIIDTNSDTILIYVCTHILYDSNSEEWNNIALKLLDHTPDEIKLNYQTPIGLTALILVSGVDDKVVMKMLGFGAVAVNLNAIEKNNKNNALMYACESAESSQSLAMLAFPSISESLKVINKNKDTPLIIATSQGMNDVVAKMLEFPPEDLQLFHKDKNGNTALDLAVDALPDTTSRELEMIMRDYEGSEMDLPDQNEDEEVNANNNNTSRSQMRPFAEGEMPPLPNIPEQIIDSSQTGFNPIMREDENITEYLQIVVIIK